MRSSHTVHLRMIRNERFFRASTLPRPYFYRALRGKDVSRHCPFCGRFLPRVIM